jgi:hypothetical protein
MHGRHGTAVARDATRHDETMEFSQNQRWATVVAHTRPEIPWRKGFMGYA